MPKVTKESRKRKQELDAADRKAWIESLGYIEVHSPTEVRCTPCGKDLKLQKGGLYYRARLDEHLAASIHRKAFKRWQQMQAKGMECTYARFRAFDPPKPCLGPALYSVPLHAHQSRLISDPTPEPPPIPTSSSPEQSCSRENSPHPDIPFPPMVETRRLPPLLGLRRFEDLSTQDIRRRSLLNGARCHNPEICQYCSVEKGLPFSPAVTVRYPGSFAPRPELSGPSTMLACVEDDGRWR